MDYKEKYEQALERARQFFEKPYLEDSAGIVEYIFPELKESEYERIRKLTLKVLNYYKDEEKSEGRMPIEIEECIAWIEKLEIKEHDVCDTCDEKASCVNPCPTKLIEEQKPAGKVEPKFHEGEWVFIEEIKGYKRGPFQIKSVDEFGYNFDEYHIIPSIYEELLSKWTIQDAKDGDVLFTSSTASHETFIFKSIDENGNIECYFAYDSEDGFREGKYHFIGKPTFKTHPVTEEQRELLFAKMKESGYEWDAEKKELKKLAYQEATKINHQKTSEWSEEDEKKIKDIVYFLDTAKKHYASVVELDACIDWLKSIKDRFTWKPSKEQIEALDFAVDCIVWEEFCIKRKVLKGLLEQLRKL